jgi:hypothetical protein
MKYIQRWSMVISYVFCSFWGKKVVKRESFWTWSIWSWLTLCTVWPSHSQITSLSSAILALGKVRSRREPNLSFGGGGGRTNMGEVMLCQKSLHKSCRMGRHIVVMKLFCLLSHFECNGHTVHKVSQWCVAADWLAPWESDCSRMCSKISDWLPSYIKATWPVLEIFKMDGYFRDSLRNLLCA